MKLQTLIQATITGLCCTTIMLNAIHAGDTTLTIRPGKLYTNCKDTVVILNAAMTKTPISIVRTFFACKLATQILDDIKNGKITDDPQMATLHISNVLAPVKEFFDIIHQFSFLIKPLVAESLVDDKFVTEQLGIKRSLLFEFLNTKQASSLETFFEQRVHSTAELKNMCLEFLIFFNDLKKNLSTDAIKAYKETLKTLADMQKQKKN